MTDHVQRASPFCREVTQTEGDLRFLRIDFAEKPGAIRIRSKEFHDRLMVLIAIASVGEQLLELRFGEEVHVYSPCVCVRPRWDSATQGQARGRGVTQESWGRPSGGTEASC